MNLALLCMLIWFHRVSFYCYLTFHSKLQLLVQNPPSVLPILPKKKCFHYNKINSTNLISFRQILYLSTAVRQCNPMPMYSQCISSNAVGSSNAAVVFQFRSVYFSSFLLSFVFYSVTFNHECVAVGLCYTLSVGIIWCEQLGICWVCFVAYGFYSIPLDYVFTLMNFRHITYSIYGLIFPLSHFREFVWYYLQPSFAVFFFQSFTAITSVFYYIFF